MNEFGNTKEVFVQRTDPNTVIGKGYRRVLYGDHGPYIEFFPMQINWDAFPHCRRKAHYAYYDEHYTIDYVVQVYEQKRDVSDKPNPPGGQWSVNHNRPNGYADYQPGFIYVAADVLLARRLGSIEVCENCRAFDVEKSAAC